jgi:hypothetical protein
MKNSGLSDSSMRREIMSSLRILTDTYPIVRHIHILYSKSIDMASILWAANIELATVRTDRSGMAERAQATSGKQWQR